MRARGEGGSRIKGAEAEGRANPTGRKGRRPEVIGRGRERVAQKASLRSQEGRQAQRSSQSGRKDERGWRWQAGIGMARSHSSRGMVARAEVLAVSRSQQAG